MWAAQVTLPEPTINDIVKMIAESAEMEPDTNTNTNTKESGESNGVRISSGRVSWPEAR